MTSTPYHLPAQDLPFSKAVRIGNTVHLSGVLALDANGNLAGDSTAEQTRAVLESIATVLSEMGSGLDRVVKVTVWLADIGDLAEFNAEYIRHFSGAFPVRSCVQAKLAKGARVEIEAMALAGG
ncbi:MAG: RidA family protein [Pigmentiphaga sp.]